MLLHKMKEVLQTYRNRKEKSKHIVLEVRDLRNINVQKKKRIPPLIKLLRAPGDYFTKEN